MCMFSVSLIQIYINAFGCFYKPNLHQQIQYVPWAKHISSAHCDFMHGWYTYYGLGEWLVCVAVADDSHSGFGGFREPENYIAMV